MSARKTYDPKSAFEDRSLPEKSNPLTAEQEDDLTKKAVPLIKASVEKLRKERPELFANNSTELDGKK